MAKSTKELLTNVCNGNLSEQDVDIIMLIDDLIKDDYDESARRHIINSQHAC